MRGNDRQEWIIEVVFSRVLIADFADLIIFHRGQDQCVRLECVRINGLDDCDCFLDAYVERAPCEMMRDISETSDQALEGSPIVRR